MARTRLLAAMMAAAFLRSPVVFRAFFPRTAACSFLLARITLDSPAGRWPRQRRNVVRVGMAYGIVAWLLVEVASVVLPTFEAPEWVMKVFTFLLLHAACVY